MKRGDHTEVTVTTRPPCDLCGQPAYYDCKTVNGSWMYACTAHYDVYGVGLGLGRGQRLVTE